MKTLFSSALAFAALGATAHATDPAVEAGPAESDWARLDREIGELSSSLSRQASETNVGGLIRVLYARSHDRAFELNAAGTASSVNSGNDIGGFAFSEVDLFAEGSINEEYDWRIQVDLDGGAARLEDAYGRYKGQGYDLTGGQFKAPVLQSNRVYPENQLMMFRTFIGQIFDFWNTGAMVSTSYEQFRAFFAVQNGADAVAEDLLFSSRVEFNLNGGTGDLEGAWGADDEVAATFGAMWFKDETDFAEGDAFGADVSVTAGIFSFHGEIVNFDGPLLANATTGTSNIPAGFGGAGGAIFGPVFLPINYAEASGGGFRVDNPTLWNSTASVLLEQLDLELGLRLEVYDDPGNTRSATLHANWYRSGRNAVWQAGVSQISSNGVQSAASGVNGTAEGIDDATLIYVGLSLGASTKNI